MPCVMLLRFPCALRALPWRMKTGSLPRRAGCGSSAGWAVRGVPGCMGGLEGAFSWCVPSVVADCLWTVRGRDLDSRSARVARIPWVRDPTRSIPEIAARRAVDLVR